MNKINSLIIAIVTVIAMIGMASATGIGSITIGGDIQGTNGQTKSVTVDVSGMSAVGALQLDVLYNSAVITVNTVTFGPAAGTGVTASNISNPSGKVTLGVISAAGISGSGTLATISFTVAGNAGDNTDLQIVKTSLVDFNILPVTTEPTITGGTFTVMGTPSSTGIDTITLGGDTQGLNGQTKSVTVDVSGMSGVGALQLDVLYDKAVITVNTVTFGPAAGTGVTASNIDNPSGKVTLGVISAAGISGSGTLATISFTVAGNAGDNTDLQIVKTNLKDFNILPVTTEPTITGGTFTVMGTPSSTGIDTITLGGDTQGLNGQTKSVTVDVSGMSGVGALQLDVLYDKAVITVNTVTFGPAAGTGVTASNIDNPSGKVTLGVISAAGISGSGTLATISFTVAGNAGDNTDLQIVKTNLKDFNVLPVNREPTITGGTFTVMGTPSSTGIDTITLGGDTQGLNGQTKSVTVDVSGMSGVGALQLDVLYDKAVITVNTVTFGPAAGTGVTASNIDNPSGKVTLGVISAAGISGSGTLATISFTVAGNAGDNTDLQIVKTNLKDFNVLPVNREPTITGGTFTVMGTPSSTGIDTITLGGDTQGLNGQTKSVTVDVSGMSGVGALQLDVLYDKAVITVNTVTFGPAAGTGVTASNIDNPSGKVTLGVISAAGISGSGTLATISFTVAG